MSVSRQSTLLAALQRAKTPVEPPPVSESVETKPSMVPRNETEGNPAPVRPSASRSSVAPSRVGKPVQFWMHEEDRKLIRELSAWLAGQGIRPTDSMVVRAALRQVKTGPGFLEFYRKAAALDGRLKNR